MKTRIKISLLVAILTLGLVSANAQILPISVGVRGGITGSDVKNDGHKSKTGYTAGIAVDLDLPMNFVIMTGLDLTSKGMKSKRFGGKLEATYLQLPIHAGYRVKLVPGIKAHFNVGPYLAQGIYGKNKIGGGDSKTFGSNDGQWKKFDWGIGVGVGVTFINKAQVRLGYDQGIADISQGGDRVRNRSLYMTVGWMFF